MSIRKKIEGARSKMKLANPILSDGEDEEQDEPQVTPLGERDEHGTLFLSPKRTQPTGLAYLNEHHLHNGIPTLRFFNERFWLWAGNRFSDRGEGGIRQRLQPWLHAAQHYVKNRQGELIAADFPDNSGTVNAAVDAIRNIAFMDRDDSPPFWIDGRELPEPSKLIPCKSFTINIGTGEKLEPTPELFNVSALDFDPEPDPEPPTLWLRFLSQLWPDDPEQIACLQEWIGLLLTPDTSFQKILLMVGPRRGGKGTIMRVVEDLVGRRNMVGLMTSSLAGSFGLQPLLGKTIATIPDARFHGDGIVTVVERLLAISGEDTVTVDQKHRESVTTKLGVRFVTLTNEIPRLTDASNALTGRFIILRLTESFYGREDRTLGLQLQSELSGIFAWAVEGLKRLRARGRFVQPAAGAALVKEMEHLSSPMAAFVDERCDVGTDHRVYCDDIYGNYKSWCVKEGITAPAAATNFARQLRAVLPKIETKQAVAGRFFAGIRLKEGQI